jgi:hypothetical protein
MCEYRSGKSCILKYRGEVYINDGSSNDMY